MQSMNNVVAEIRRIDLRLDGDLVGNADDPIKRTNITQGCFPLILPFDLTCERDPALLDIDFDCVARYINGPIKTV